MVGGILCFSVLGPCMSLRRLCFCLCLSLFLPWCVEFESPAVSCCLCDVDGAVLEFGVEHSVMCPHVSVLLGSGLNICLRCSVHGGLNICLRCFVHV